MNNLVNIFLFLNELLCIPAYLVSLLIFSSHIFVEPNVFDEI